MAPDDVVRAWAKHHKDTVGAEPKTAIVVAAAGGGIRAAAWTARVLTGLQEKCGTEFGSSLLLVSSVSGGSIGSMFVVAGYGDDRSFPAAGSSLEQVRFNAERSVLSAAGWGFLYPDLARTVPFLGAMLVPQDRDRGWALENAWISGWKKPPNISDWRNDVADGRRPAVIFNGTSAETGKRVVIGTADVTSGWAVRLVPDAGVDFPVVTAARLSATFPYVSPEARPSQGPNSSRPHIADGGYYDNSGLLSALEWSVAASELKKYRVVLLLIDTTAGTPRPTKTWSWQRQIVGPAETLINVRSSSQGDRDSMELGWAKSQIGSQAAQKIDFLYEAANAETTSQVQKSIFSRIQPDESYPLSWHLNKAQIAYIEDAWKSAKNQEAADGVCHLLNSR